MRVFLAAPQHLREERTVLHTIVEKLNQKIQAAHGFLRPLEVVEWAPRRPETPPPLPAQGDFFVGLAWLHFDPSDGDSGATEETFREAQEKWRGSSSGQCYLYRCMRLPSSLHDINGAAFDAVSRVFDSVRTENETTGISYREYFSASGLQEHLERDLSEIARTLAQEKPPATQPQAPKEGREFEYRLRAGEAYEVTYLAIDIANGTELAERYASRPRDLEALSRSFRSLVTETASSYGGEAFTWSEFGGLLLFWRKRSQDHAIMTGLKVLHNLPVFNLDLEQNPLPEPVQIRAAAHDAVIVFRLPITDIVSEEMEFVTGLENGYTAPGELTISKRLLGKVDPRLAPRFSFKGRFEDEPVYGCRLPSTDQPPQQANLDELSARVEHEISMASSLLEAFASAPDATGLDAVSAAVDEAYSGLNRFALRFSQLDQSWSADFLESLSKHAKKLRDLETALWRKLRLRFAEHKASTGSPGQLEATLKAASRRRARSVVILEKLGERVGALAATEGETGGPTTAIGERLLSKIQHLLRADALDSETVLTDILLNHKVGLLEFAAAHESDQRHAPLLTKLWQSADLVLLDDFFAIRGHRRAADERMADVLAGEPIADQRFRVVLLALGSERPPDAETLRREFSERRLEASEEDLQITWRCLVLGHGNAVVRTASAMNLTTDSMWQAISHPSIPVASMHAIGERVKRMEDRDAQKIFFDCTRSRIGQAVETMRTRDDLRSVGQLIMLLLEFPFLVESGYFERFDDILRSFLERTKKAGINVEYFESVRRTLEAASRDQKGKDAGKLPAGIKRLPLTLQRRLASESRYLLWFVTHPDARIATETLRHIGLANIDRVLRLREISGAVLNSLLRKPELFTRTQPVVTALNHPKCEHSFASHHVSNLMRSRQGQKLLEQLARNPSANPGVRALAQRALGAHRGRG